MAFCSTPMSLCGIIISAWGVIQLQQTAEKSPGNIVGITDEASNNDIKREILQKTSEEPLYNKITKGVQRRATCEVSQAAFGKLIELNKLNIGWLRCRIYEVVSLLRCFICWKIGHKTGDCKLKEDDREIIENTIKSGLCTNCVKDKVIMGVFYYAESLALSEDLPVPEDTPLDEFVNKAMQGYARNAHNCWIAACLYVLTLAVSIHQLYLNNRN